MRRGFFAASMIMMAAVLAVVLWQTALMFGYFPSGDLAGHIVYAHFLETYGFHQVVPNWGNLVLFVSYPPLASFALRSASHTDTH